MSLDFRNDRIDKMLILNRRIVCGYRVIFFILGLTLSSGLLYSQSVQEEKKEPVTNSVIEKEDKPKLEKPAEEKPKVEKTSEEKTSIEKPPEEKAKTEVAPEKKSESVKVESGPGKGFKFETADKLHSIDLRLRIQARADQSMNIDPSTNTTNFMVRRSRIQMGGKLFGDDWKYYFQIGLADRDKETDRRIPLRDASITYNKHRDAKIIFGQMKIPFSRQRWNSSSALQMVDRSIVQSELNLDRDVGVVLFSEDFLGMDRKLAYYVGVFGGNGRNRAENNTPGVLTVARLIYSPWGGISKGGDNNDWLSEVDFNRYKTPKVAFGGAVAYNKNSNRSLSTFGTQYEFARFDYAHATAEVYLKWLGFSFTLEGLKRKADSPYDEKNISGTLKREYSRAAEGAFIQFGYLFQNNWEVSMRFGEYKPIGQTDPNLVRSSEKGIALSHYFLSHNLKLQMDYFNYKGNPAVADGDHQLRFQMQVFY